MQHDEFAASVGLSTAGSAREQAAAALATWEAGNGSPILHVFSLEKFVAPFIDFIEEHWTDTSRHLFICIGDATRFPVRQRPNLIVMPRSTERWALTHLARALNSAGKVILHGLFDQGVVAQLALQPWVRPKCYWIIWGGDLYVRKLGERTWKWRVAEFFRGIVIRRLGCLVSFMEGDVALAREWYGATGAYRECLAYPSNLFKESDVAVGNPRGGPLHVLVGNSADPSNGHFEVLERLAAANLPPDVRIYAPLSYGDPQHARAVAERGRQLFGTCFVPMLEFMPLPSYLAWLESIDIALFNHSRQQGMGNAITLLGMGKKVHLRTDVSQWQLFRRLGLAVFPIDAIVGERLPAVDAARNRQIVRVQFSEGMLREQLDRIFEE